MGRKKIGSSYEPKPGRAWIGIAYPESLVSDWLEQLQNSLVSGAISPLHDQDVYTAADEESATKAQRTRHDYPVVAGGAKKPHYHIMLVFTTDKSYSQICEILQPLGVVMIQRAQDRNAVIRYFCHLDQPSKHRYSIDDLVLLGSYDPGDALSPKWAEGRSVWKQILELADKHTYFNEFFSELSLNERMLDYASSHVSQLNLVRWSITDRRKQAYHDHIRTREEIEDLRHRDNEKDEYRYVIDEATGELWVDVLHKQNKEK